MNSNPKSDWKKTLEDLQTTISDSTSNNQELIDKSRNWFMKIPSGGKVVVVLVGGILGLTLIKTVFSLVQLVITLGVLGVIIYFIYQFFLRNNNN